MEFLANIGKTGWPKEVWYRYDENLVKYKLNDRSPEVILVEDVTLSALLKETKAFQDEAIEEWPVLLLEMQEHEVNPRSHIATLVQPSNRDVYSITKEFDKAGAEYMLITPPTITDLCNIAYFHSRFGSSSWFIGKSKDEIIRIITERVEIVGPITRSVCNTEKTFLKAKRRLDAEIDQVFGIIGQVSVDNIPKGGKRFVAPFVEDESVVPYLENVALVHGSLRFLSDYIAVKIGNACKSSERRKVLEKYDFIHQAEEAIVRFGLMEQSKRLIGPKESDNNVIHDDWCVANWSFSKNPQGDDKLLTAEDKITFEETGISTCTRKVYFDAQCLNCPVDKLDERTLYVSTKHNGKLYDCMYVNKGLKVVFMFNATAQQPHSHLLKLSTVKDVMMRLKITENGYVVRFFYCCRSDMLIKKGRDDVEGLDLYIAKIKMFSCDKVVEVLNPVKDEEET